MFTEQDRNSPVSESAVHDVAIDGIAREGDGNIYGFCDLCARHEGWRPCKIKIERVLRKFAVAALNEQN